MYDFEKLSKQVKNGEGILLTVPSMYNEQIYIFFLRNANNGKGIEFNAAGWFIQETETGILKAIKTAELKHGHTVLTNNKKYLKINLAIKMTKKINQF